jgi:hypothetical protein
MSVVRYLSIASPSSTSEGSANPAPSIASSRRRGIPPGAPSAVPSRRCAGHPIRLEGPMPYRSAEAVRSIHGVRARWIRSANAGAAGTARRLRHDRVPYSLPEL